MLEACATVRRSRSSAGTAPRWRTGRAAGTRTNNLARLPATRALKITGLVPGVRRTTRLLSQPHPTGQVTTGKAGPRQRHPAGLPPLRSKWHQGPAGSLGGKLRQELLALPGTETTDAAPSGYPGTIHDRSGAGLADARHSAEDLGELRLAGEVIIAAKHAGERQGACFGVGQQRRPAARASRAFASASWRCSGDRTGSAIGLPLSQAAQQRRHLPCHPPIMAGDGDSARSRWPSPSEPGARRRGSERNKHVANRCQRPRGLWLPRVPAILAGVRNRAQCGITIRQAAWTPLLCNTIGHLSHAPLCRIHGRSPNGSLPWPVAQAPDPPDRSG